MLLDLFIYLFFFSSRRRHTRYWRDWSSDVCSSDLVMGMLSSRGVLEPRRWVVVVWGALAGAVASICLLSGGLEGLQQAAIISAAPFVLVMIGRSEQHTSELQSRQYLVCRLLLEKKKV